jgi:hypothetical protein
MAFQWFYAVSDVEVGPISSDELLDLAQCGTVKRDTAVRKAPDGDWVLAERIKGLFPDPDGLPPSPPQPFSRDCATTIEERLARLEKAVENGTRLDGSTHEGITAHAFCVEDAEGNRRVLLGTSDSGAGVNVFDEKGKTRISLIDTEGGISLTLTDNAHSASVSLVKGESAGVTLQGADGNVRVVLASGQKGAALSLCDESGADRAMLQFSEMGPTLKFLNENGECCALWCGSLLMLFDDQGNVIWQTS